MTTMGLRMLGLAAFITILGSSQGRKCKLDKIEAASLSGGGYNIRTRSLEHCIEQCKDWKRYVDTQCKNCKSWAAYVDFECKAVSYMIFAGGIKRCGLHRVTRSERSLEERRETGWTYVGVECTDHVDLSCFSEIKGGFMKEEIVAAMANKTLKECKEHCIKFSEEGVTNCRSLSYYPERKDCVLNSASKDTDPKLFSTDLIGMTVNYYANNC